MPKTLWYKITKSQVIRFLLSAGSGFLVDIGAYYLFYRVVLTQITYVIFNYTVRNSTLSLFISFFLGVLVNFTMTRLLVFAESKLPLHKQFFRFISVAIVGFFANLGVLKLLIQSFNIYPPVARICAALSLFVASYFIHKFFSFSLSLRTHHAAKPDHQPGN
ncbi:GtrA family protein [Inquilinus sp. KBS0705]|nr:GtrA family protein [Inquilinus sp. KBS0705]